MRRACLCVFVAAILSAQVVSAAQPCDDLAASADAWHEIATALDGFMVNGMTAADEQAAESAVAEEMAATGATVQGLLSGDPDEAEIGQMLRQRLLAVDGAVELDQAIRAIAALIDDLDRTVALCDEEYGDGGGIQAGGTSVRVTYRPPADPAHTEMAAFIEASGLYDEVAAHVSSVLRLPRDLPVAFESCGQPNAFYQGQTGTVTMCWEFFALFSQQFSQMPPEEMRQAVLDSGTFFLLHELGHALVHQLELPITGREEDSVDNLATLIVLTADGPEALLAALGTFGAFAAGENQQQQLPFWDEHSLSSQRFYDIACLIYGSDPQRHAGMVGQLIPEGRAQRCPSEFQQKDRAWDKLLAPYYVGD